MRRHESGIGCGARARVSHTRSREVSDLHTVCLWRAVELQCAALRPRGSLRDRGRRCGFAPRCPGHNPGSVRGSSPREAAKCPPGLAHLASAGGGAPRGAAFSLHVRRGERARHRRLRLPALRSLGFSAGAKGRGRTPRRQKNRGDDACLFHHAALFENLEL